MLLCCYSSDNMHLKYTSILLTFSYVRNTRFKVMVFNATFNNISFISWQSVLLLEETRVPRENHWQTLSHNVVWSTPHQWVGFEYTNYVVIGTDCAGSCKSNYHTITTMTSPINIRCNVVTYSFAKFDNCFLSTNVFFEIRMRLSSSVIIFCERNLWIILFYINNITIKINIFIAIHRLLLKYIQCKKTFI
jgi:hypothetical protein